MNSDLDAVYKHKPVSLWVEDGLTRAYLQAVWDDADFQLLIGGGHENLRGISEDAQRRRLINVFAVMDRDFRRTNRGRWEAHPNDLRAYVLESFEVENLLLDVNALAAASRVLGKPRDAEEISARLREEASKMTAWMACRKVLADLSSARGVDFPAHPTPVDVPDLDKAMNWIVGSSWVIQRVPALTGLVGAAHIEEELEKASKLYQDDLDSTRYLISFCGKELLNTLRVWAFHRCTGPEGAEDIAKEVADHQNRLASVPLELMELRGSIRARVGLPPPAGAPA